MTYIYLARNISLEGEAPAKYADLSFSEWNRCDYRTIGGDKGDLLFEGYIIRDGRTVLYKPKLRTTLEGLLPDEVDEIAQEILDFSFASIGFEGLT